MINIPRILTYLIISILVLSVLWLTQGHPAPQPQGIYLPSKPTLLIPKNKALIKIFKEMPLGAEVVGNINVMMEVTTISGQAEQQVIDYAVELAAEQGADGVVITYFFASGGESGMGKGNYFLRAQAIKNF